MSVRISLAVEARDVRVPPYRFQSRERERERERESRESWNSSLDPS